MIGPVRVRGRSRIAAWGTAVAGALALLVGACNSSSGANAGGRIVVVDGSGAPVAGALLILMPEDENQSSTPLGHTTAELRELTSDSQGVIHAQLDDCLWDSDGCYHFRVRRYGYDDVTMSVSKDLFPPVLRVELKPREQGASAPAPNGP